MRKFSMFKKLAAGALALLATSSAYAVDVLHTVVKPAFDALLADALVLSGIVMPIVVGILGLVLVIKLIKRFGNKI